MRCTPGWRRSRQRSWPARSRCPTSSAVEARGITVRFGARTALEEVSLSAAGGEVLAVVGENGAGKSTLMNVLYGLVRPAFGEVFVQGKKLALAGPAEAIAAGMGMVHQHFRLVHTLTVAENIALGFEPRLGARFDQQEAARRVEALAADLGFQVDPHALVEDLPVGAQQRVEILKSLSRGARVLILDEPTAVLTPQECDELFRVVKALAAAGKTVLFISHKLGEVMAVASRVVVMRAGRVVTEAMTAATSAKEISRAMVGREVVTSLPRAAFAPGEVVLALENVSASGARGRPALQGVSLSVRAGEILGIAGVEGNGQAELEEVVCGLAGTTGGMVTRHGPVAHVPGDRLRDGVVVRFPVEENLLLGRVRERRFRSMAGLSLAAVRRFASESLAAFDVRPADPELAIGALSGGNQQKVVLARELSRAPKLLVAAQPTRGVDVGAVEQIHARLLAERERGTAVLLISADLGEILALSDRVAVLYGGKVVHLTDAATTDERTLGAFMTGGA